MTQQVSQTHFNKKSLTAINTLQALITDNTPSKRAPWEAVHIDEDCSNMSGLHHNELFYNCKFDDLTDLTLSNCDLSKSQFTTDDLKKCLNFTVTVNCHSVRDVEYSELLFDMFLIMMAKTKGNDEKREKLLEIVGKEKADRIFKLISRLER